MSQINKNTSFKGQITLALTGASGAPYALRLIESLVAANYQIFLLVSLAAKVVLDTEVGLKLPSAPDKVGAYFIEKYQGQPEQIIAFGKEQWFSPVASGSAAPKTMVVCPCSTGTLAAISQG